MRPVLIALASAAALVACSQGQAPAEPVATGAPDPAPSLTTTAPSRTSEAAPPLPREVATMPAAFRGTWGYAEGDCSPGTELSMVIGEKSIEFYESLGTITSIKVESPTSVVIDLAMEGEGEKWTVQNRLALSENGAILTPTDTARTSEQLMPRKRCPA